MMAIERGLREKLRRYGATLEKSMFWVPLSDDMELSASIFSYGHSVLFSFKNGRKQLCFQ